MSADSKLAELSDAVGVFPEFTDMQKRLCPTSPDTQRALLRANGFDVDNAAAVTETLAVLRSAEASAYVPRDIVAKTRSRLQIPVNTPVQWAVVSEETAEILAEGKADNGIDIPPLPMGIHSLEISGAQGEQTANLIAAPDAAPSLPHLTGQQRIWGVIAALYGLEGERSNEVADYLDLAEMAAVAGAQGAAFLGINPVHAIGWAAADTISPYSPTHRGFLNTSHIAVADPVGNTAPKSSLIDYSGHTSRLRPALWAAYQNWMNSCLLYTSDAADD